MKKIITYIISCFILVGGITAQEATENILSQIEMNNPELRALAEKGNAQKLENRTMNNLQNPEVEVTHTPRRRVEPRNTEVEVSQSFDFPTAYRKRGQYIDNLNEQEDLQYQIRKREIFYEVYALLVDGIYYKRKLQYLTLRKEDAEKMYEAYDRMMKEGQIDILEYNKTKLNLLESRRGVDLCKIELTNVNNRLRILNGGTPIGSLPTNYDEYLLPMDFEGWYSTIKNNNPQILLSESKWEMGKRKESMVKSLNLPKLKVGYVAEIDPYQTKSGFLVGFSIPLWQGRNTLKASKALTTSLLYEKQDEELRFKENIKVNYEKALSYKKLLADYSEITENMQGEALLKKSLELGRINVLTYLQELLIYYQSVDSFFDIEREYYLSVIDLKQWEK